MEENKFINFFSKHWSKLLLGFLAIASIAAWTERFLSSNHTQTTQDYLLANQIFERCQRGEHLDVESIEMAENILDRHPELHPKYDALLALTFFSQTKTDKGMKYARSLIEHVAATLPSYYKEYATTSLLIAEEKYDEAYLAAQKLETELKAEEGFPTLDAMNTLRLLFLADRLDNADQKRITWEKLEKHPSFLSIQPLFHEGSLSLSDYIWHTSRL